MSFFKKGGPAAARVLAVLLAALLVAGLVPWQAAHAAGTEENGGDPAADVAAGIDAGSDAASGGNVVMSNTTVDPAADTSGGDATQDPTIGTDHPSTTHSDSCPVDSNGNGYACPYGSTIQFKLSPKLGSGNANSLSFDKETEITVCVDDDPNLTKTVKYSSGTVNVTMKGIMPGEHSIKITGADSGKYAFSKTTFEPVENWFTHKTTGQPLPGNSISVNGTVGKLTCPAASANPAQLYLDDLSVWVFPHYELQTTTVTASVDIKGYTVAEKNEKTYAFQLQDADGTPVAGQEIKEAKQSNGWTVSWKDLEYGTYRVRNVDTGEVLSGDTIKFVDEKLEDKISIKATVSWPGFKASEIPRSVTLELRDANDKPYETQTVGTIYAGGWTYTWSVPRGDYTVVEKNPPEGVTVSYDYAVSTSRNRVDWAVVNSKADTKSVQLVWDGFGSKPPVSSVQVVLRDNTGTAVKTESLTAANGWSAAWTDLDPSKSYYLEETTTGNWMASISKTSSGWYIVNSASMSVTATLTWSGYSNNAYPVDEVYVQLYDGSGRRVGSPVALSASRGWRYVWTDLAADNYTVEEITAGNWRADYKITGGLSSGSGSSGTTGATNMTVAITNTKTNTSSVTVKVSWSGFDKSSEPVDYVRMILRDSSGEQYGGAVQVKSSQGWSYTWKDLPPDDYTVEQTTTGNWTTKYSQSGTAWTVTNTKSDTLSVTAKVTWAGYSKDSDHPDTVVLKLSRAGAAQGDPDFGGLMGTASKSNNWTYTWTDLQNSGVYTLEEITSGDWSVEYVKGQGSGKAEIWTVKNTKSSGSGSGEGGQGTTKGDGKGVVNVALTWTGYDKIPVTSVKLQLLEGGAVIDSKDVSGTGNTWTTSFTGVDSTKAASGGYSVKEVVPDGQKWYSKMERNGNSYVLVNSDVPLAGGTQLGPTGGGTSAAGDGGSESLGPTGGGTSAAGGTGTYSNPPKTGDMTWLFLSATAAMAGVTGVLAWRRKRLFTRS